jgi:formamidopyrimidine-DNA glycosylase
LDEAAWKQWEFARTLGPEPLENTPQNLAARLDLPASRRAIKAVLLDQRVIAGVGNIYADESLFAAKIHPATPTSRLSAAQRLRLACAVQDVLHAAIAAGGSTINDYRNAMGAPGLFQERFAVYGRAGLPCPQCGTLLARLRVAGRGTVVCPRCQGTGSAPHATPRIR